MKKENITTEIVEPGKTIQKSEEQEKMELQEELNLKKKELDQNIKILYGFKTKDAIHIGCDELLDQHTKLLEMREIEYAYNQPATRMWEFQRRPRWIQLNRELMRLPMVKQEKAIIENIKTQKESIIENNPKLQTRINEIEKKLGLKITNFNEVKQDAK